MKYGFGLVLTGVLAGLVFLIGCGSSPRVRDASQPYPADSEYAKFSPKNSVDEAEFAKTATASDSPVLQAIFQQTKPRFTLRKIDELLIFQPSKYPAGNWRPTGLEFEDVKFKSSDGTKLHA